MRTVVKKPVISEKSISQQGAANKYTFLVDRSATQDQIKKEVGKIFNVTVESVNIVRLPGKSKTFKRISGSQAERKHAIVTLKKGDTITLFEEKKS